MGEQTETAWAAGLFDGEGSTSIQFDKRYVGRRGTFRLSMAQSGDDRAIEILERFQRAVGGLGKIYGPYQPPPPSRKPKYHWYSHNARALEALNILRPYLSRAKRLQAALTEIQWEYSTSKGGRRG